MLRAVSSPDHFLDTPWPEQEGHLQNIKTHLDLLLLALESLTAIGSEAILQAARDLQLQLASDRVNLWRLRQSNPLRKGSGGRKKLDVEEARALVLICCHLAQQHQYRIRTAVTRLEELTERKRSPHEAAVLGDYLDHFCNLYEERMHDAELPAIASLTQLALKLLIDLLFYSGSGGPRRLWLALIDCSLVRTSSSPQPAS